MREIRFRAWHNEKGWADEVTLFGDGSFSARFGNVEGFDESEVELMQFTGLLDKNGREIYEGDILKMADATAKVVFWELPPAFGLDFYHNEEKWCEDWNLADDSERMEVIGNIYENPDLLT